MKNTDLPTPAEPRPFRISINAGTLRDYEIPLEEQIELYASAGFESAELWMTDIENFLSRGGSAREISDALAARKIRLEGVLGFAKWLADAPEERRAGFEKLKREVDIVSELGGRTIAATGMGMGELDRSKFVSYAQSYREILDYAAPKNVTPLLELWGHRALCRLEDLAHIAILAGRERANFLLDFYHLYRGGNSFESLAQINISKLTVIHLNDYPAFPERGKLTDADRVFAGDGACPFGKILPMLAENGFKGALSVELFNKGYMQKMSPLQLLETCRTKAVSLIKGFDL